MITSEFWQNKKVFLTGHTGFKGGWLCVWLSLLGAKVKGYALSPETEPNIFEQAGIGDCVESQIGDIRDFDKLKSSINSFNPDILIHMAAQSLVRLSYQQPLETYDVNVMGTAKVLQAARFCANLGAVINVTSDKCYENQERCRGYRENEPMGGYDPYSSSKACSELISSAFRQSFLQNEEIGLASARAGNVIGGGDWAADRIIPDILRAFQNNRPVIIRNPESIRPWQHVLEPLSGYMLLAEKLYGNPQKYAQAWNFGPRTNDVKPVRWIVEKMSASWAGGDWVIEPDNKLHEATYLQLDSSKAINELGWSPRWSIEESLEKVIQWHRHWQQGDDVMAVMHDHIDDYMSV